MQEIWKPIEGHPGYEVSNLGRVKSLEKKVYNKRGNLHRKWPERILKQSHNTFGYLQVNLSNRSRMRIVHRLVAETFLPNPQNYPVVNHKNGIKDDNRVENLEWCTVSYNTWHSCNVLGKMSYPVRCVETGKEWPSIRECSREVGRGVFGALRQKRTHKGQHYKILTKAK